MPGRKDPQWTKGTINSDGSSKSACSHAWDHLLETDATDIEDTISIPDGPLHVLSLQSVGSTDMSDDDESIVSSSSYTTHRQGVARMARVGLILGILSAASFATTNLILDTLELRPEGHDQAQAMAIKSERYAALRRVLLSVSTEDSLSQYHTPQIKALRWIANKDPQKLQPSDRDHLIQRYSLAVLYFATNELGWTRDLNWLTADHECEWKGEGGIRSCDEHKNVTDLSLWNNLKGQLPVELGLLTKLQVLYLARNQLYGTIPTELGNLVDLTYLGLQHNLLSGTIPAAHFVKLTKLRTLYLEKNDFTGTIHQLEPICQLKAEGDPGKEQPTGGGSLRQLTSDCRQLVQWKPPEIRCECCTKCFAA